MKTWTLVWFLVFPPNDAGQTTWELHTQGDLTRQQCFHLLAEKDADFKEDAMDGEIMGHEIYCKGTENGPVGEGE